MLNMKWTLSAVLLAGAFTASAQSAEHYRGSFNLPVEARFGNVVLQPGSYTITTLEGAKGIRITGDQGKATLLAAGADRKPETHKAKIVLVESNGTYALESFESGSMGQTLHFLVTKPRGSVERAAVAKPTMEVGLQ